ncbi:Diamine acetyltransferase 1, partial [Datura stramonium]|nr:Diamine acetyltransferase 1 [Datura stramonium]
AMKMEMGIVDWLLADWNEESINCYEKMGAHYIPEYRLCKLSGDHEQSCLCFGIGLVLKKRKFPKAATKETDLQLKYSDLDEL